MKIENNEIFHEFVLAIYVQGLKDYVSLKRSNKCYGAKYISESAKSVRNWLVNSECANYLIEDTESFMNTFDLYEDNLYKEGKTIRFNRLFEGIV